MLHILRIPDKCQNFIYLSKREEGKSFYPALPPPIITLLPPTHFLIGGREGREIEREGEGARTGRRGSFGRGRGERQSHTDCSRSLKKGKIDGGDLSLTHEDPEVFPVGLSVIRCLASL